MRLIVTIFLSAFRYSFYIFIIFLFFFLHPVLFSLSHTLPISIFFLLLLLCASNFLYIKIPFDATVLQRYTVNVINYELQDAEWAREECYPRRRYTIIRRLFLRSSKSIFNTHNYTEVYKYMVYILIVNIYFSGHIFQNFFLFSLAFFYSCTLRVKKNHSFHKIPNFSLMAD